MNDEQMTALAESERAARAEADHLGRRPAYPLYKSGPIIAVGTIRPYGYHACDDDGLRAAVGAAEAGSRLGTLVHVAVRVLSSDADRIVCAFQGGEVMPLEDARRIAVNGYGG